MRIAVCDDEKIYLERTCELIASFLNGKGIEYSIDAYESSKKFIESKNDYDFAFLDIEMGEINGLKIAKNLRERKYDTFIFFITHFQFYLDNAMNMSPFRYLPKPLDEARFSASLSAALRRWKQSQKKMYVTDCKLKAGFWVVMHDILFIENSNRKVRIVTKRNEFYVSEKYKDLREELIADEDFCESHQSFIINFNYVSYHDKETVWLESGSNKYDVHISRRRLPEFKLKFLKFAGDIK